MGVHSRVYVSVCMYVHAGDESMYVCACVLTFMWTNVHVYTYLLM